MSIDRVSGVLVSADDASTLVDALSVFSRVLAERGSRPSPKLVDLQRRLSRATTDATRRQTGTYASDVAAQPESASSFEYEFIDSERAAAILGCTAGNVRDLARRRRLPGIVAGGRWVFPAAAVVARANR